MGVNRVAIQSKIPIIKNLDSFLNFKNETKSNKGFIQSLICYKSFYFLKILKRKDCIIEFTLKIYFIYIRYCFDMFRFVTLNSRMK